MVKIIQEISLINYLINKRELSFDDFICWVGKHYNESSLFQTVMHDCTCISDGM